ncbi:MULTISPECIES: SDR family NAD(P)-dependent oxidoreductase [unclassified Streptomyces]|uniref:SDR family NAD(P)-dependent oxidoreductase n=1 Tax=unclassified Streptomyces TaxID=2593676 RepID=UPI00099D49EC|nr:MULTISPECIES: SDR family NAD(P)-dependent oxidoreductase [unclassified Streptomyces]
MTLSVAIGGVRARVESSDACPRPAMVRPASTSHTSYGKQMTKTIFVTEGADGWGEYIARVLVDAGHTVYVGEGQGGIESTPVGAVSDDGAEARHKGLRTVTFEALDQYSIAAAVRKIVDETDGIDVVIYTASQATFGPAESFTPYQLSQVYDIGVLSVQRITRAVLPSMRERRDGLLIWVGASVDPRPAPLAGPGHAVRAALQQLAASYATELATFGIDATFLTYSPEHLLDTQVASAPLQPGDPDTAQAYRQVVERGLPLPEQQSFDPAAHARKVAECVSSIIDAPQGSRPARVTL